MDDLMFRLSCPGLDGIGKYIENPLFGRFCTQMKEKYKCAEKIEYSSCSWEKGWNIKFKKAGKTLCTIYPRKGYFTVMIVIGLKEKETVTAMLSEFTLEIQEIYRKTKEGNGQKWMMIDVEDAGKKYNDIFRLIDIRRG